MHITRRLATREATEADTIALEHKIGHTLPDEYRRFLLQTNGGRPEPECFEFTGFNGEIEDAVVDIFFSLDEKDKDYYISSEIFDYDGRIPDDTLPIACDTFGNLILIGLVSERRGKIFFWDHEREDGEDLNANVSLVSNGFDEFTARLFSLVE